MSSAQQFVISSRPIGWRCRHCGGILQLPIMDQSSAAMDSAMQEAFAAHVCNSHENDKEAKAKKAEVKF